MVFWLGLWETCLMPYMLCTWEDMETTDGRQKGSEACFAFASLSFPGGGTHMEEGRRGGMRTGNTGNPS